MPVTTTTAAIQERKGGTTFKGSPLTLIGPELAVGATAPDFQVLANDLTPVTLKAFGGKPLLICSVPSVDTPVCDAETRRFNEEAARLPSVQVLAISMDIPFAQKRWCGAAGADRVRVVSDHKEASFGRAFGVLIKELRLLSRAVFLIDGTGTLRYVEYVKEMSAHPNYDAALAAARPLAG